jgi:glycosyltransferase involved in cell wall biosynthesis
LAAETQLSIIIPTHNRYARAVRAVRALSDQILATSLASAVEVVVVDDGSDLACAARMKAFILQQNHPFLRFVELPENRGASGARNAGALASRGAIVAFLDDDIVPAVDYVGAIIRSHHQHPEALVINGNLRPLRPSVYADFWFYYYNAVFNRPGESFFTIPMLASGNFSMKRSLLARVDPLFDTSLTSREDLDLYIRLKAVGVPSYKDDSILAFNDCRHTLVGFLKQRMWYGRGQEQLIAKHGKAVVLTQAIAPPNKKFLHLYILLRLTQKTARGYARFRRALHSVVTLAGTRHS